MKTIEELYSLKGQYESKLIELKLRFREAMFADSQIPIMERHREIKGKLDKLNKKIKLLSK
jgi:hypothetical protein